jgi:copper chaperone CopZ
MKCNHCKANVEKSILKCSGVQEVETDLSTGKVVTHGKINRKEIIKAIEDLGFEVTNFQ